jgi:hypothetical protein
MIRKGTTPTQQFNTSIDLSGASVLYITYKQYGKIVIEKTIEDCDITASYVATELSQEETLLFDATRKVEIQIRAKFPDGTAVASNIMETDAGAILKGGII